MTNKESKEVQEAIADGADPEVVKAMQEEGLIAPTSGEEPVHVEKTAEEKAAEAAAAKAAEDAAAGPKGAEDGGDKGKDADVDNGDGDQGKQDGEDEDGDEGANPNRPIKSIPAWKAKEMAKEAAEKAAAEAKADAEVEFNKKLADLGREGTGKASDDEVEKFAEEFNLTPEIARSMIDRQAEILEKRLGLGDIRKDIAERKTRDQDLEEQRGFETEFASKATQDAFGAAANGQQITEEVKAKVKELAYRSDYARYRLADIIRLEAANLFTNASAPRERRTAEAGRGGTSHGHAQKNIGEMSPDEIIDLSDEEFLRLSNEMGKQNSNFTSLTRASRGRK